MQERIAKSVQRRRWPDEVYARAQALVDARPDAAPSSIAAVLAEEFEPAPQPKTIADWLKRGVVRRPDPGEVWTLARAEPGEARVLLPVLRWMTIEYRGPSQLTTSVAKWIVRIVDAAPDIPIPEALGLAQAYDRRPADTSNLDHYLAFRPWASEKALGEHQAAVGRRWIGGWIGYVTPRDEEIES